VPAATGCRAGHYAVRFLLIRCRQNVAAASGFHRLSAAASVSRQLRPRLDRVLGLLNGKSSASENKKRLLLFFIKFY